MSFINSNTFCIFSSSSESASDMLEGILCFVLVSEYSLQVVTMCFSVSDVLHVLQNGGFRPLIR
ncbi:unnamed protein product [Nezara viridula]|uniref:Uncharacterized protein n=1 Tax=Nezara viridula TaxID=85310 RepID=A0A9P0DYL6_NEZVI|nr:unnamed protein product [Nezara viridula]